MWESDGSLWGTIHHSQPEARMEKRATTCSRDNGVGAISITMPSSKVVFFEENVLSDKTNENLVGSVEHPISKVGSLFAAVKNAVGLALSSRSGYAGILCLADDLSTTAFGIENNRHMTFNISIHSDEKGCPESWDSVLGKL